MKLYALIMTLLTLGLIYAHLYNNQYDYHLNVKNETGILYSDGKVIGSFKLHGELDSLIINDNQ